MKKLFYFLAMAAVVLGMASCNGDEEVNDPNVPFAIKISNITNQSVQLTFTPKDQTKGYFWGMNRASEVYADAQTVEAFATQDIHNSFSDYDALEISGFMDTGTKTYKIPSVESGFDDNLLPSTEYIVFVTHVEKGSKGEIVIGQVVFNAFKTK